MLSALLVIGGVLVGLVLLLVLIVSLSARSSRGTRSSRAAAPRTPGWVVDSGREHPDAWAPLSHTSTEIRALR